MICIGETRFANKEGKVKVNEFIKKEPVSQSEFMNLHLRDESCERESGGK